MLIKDDDPLQMAIDAKIAVDKVKMHVQGVKRAVQQKIMKGEKLSKIEQDAVRDYLLRARDVVEKIMRKVAP